jgi:glycosyltransferase involved in cell wall biosynthesis
MKIALIGPGIMSIPPQGWGAVETVIFDLYNQLKKLDHEVYIINKMRQTPNDQSNPTTNYCRELITEINDGNYDFVHLHYDCLYHILPYLNAKKIGFTSQYPYIDNEEKHHNDSFKPILDFMIHNNNNNKILNFMVAIKDIEFLIKKGANPKFLFLLENGIDSDSFIFKENGNLMDKTIYLGQINERKGQHKYCHLKNIDIIGPYLDNTSQNRSHNTLMNYKGSWTRNDVFNKLTDYGNLLLLSSGEADPLVVKEALMCGIGVVINATSSKNLASSNFITIIEDEKMNDLNYIQTKIDENRNNSILMRSEIRMYAENTFSWNHFIHKYINNISHFSI